MVKELHHLEKINSLFLISYSSSTFYLFVEEEEKKAVQIKAF